jgi:DNA (cytosine-5)-methyltransferase 3A
MSCGRIALDRLGIKVTNYFASEIDKYAIKVSKHNWPDNTHIGDVTKISYSNGILKTENGEYDVGQIDLLLAGSPCQGFSMAGKQLAFDDPRSKLYFEFERIKNEIKPKHFLLENVKMKKEYKGLISSRLGVEPVAINSNLVSAQNRYRLYWTDLEVSEQPQDKGIVLKGILESDVPNEFFVKAGRLTWLKTFGEVKEKDGYVAFNPDKAKCLTARGEPSWNTTYITGDTTSCNGCAFRGQYVNGRVEKQLNIRDDGLANCLTASYASKLARVCDEGFITPGECERLQTVPDGYTSCVSNSQRYKMLGNGWTVDVICHILQSLKT